MSIRRIWIISVANRSVLYTRAFPIIEQNARSKGFSPCLSFSSSSDEEDFVSSLFSTLGLENPFVRRNSLTTDSLGFYSIESNEKFKSEYDCSTENQLPVVSVTFKAVDLWPVIVIESNGILFCALPLIQSDSKELLDHISVSTSFCALQNFVTNFNKDNKLPSLEEYVNGMMPFGTFLGHSLGSYVEPPITRKGEDFVISVKEVPVTNGAVSKTSPSPSEIEPVEEEPNNGTQMTGHLSMLHSQWWNFGRKQWQDKFCILDGDKLFVTINQQHEKESSKRKKALVLDLNAFDICEPHLHRDNCFVICSTIASGQYEKRHVFVADSEEVMNKWLANIQTAIKDARKNRKKAKVLKEDSVTSKDTLAQLNQVQLSAVDEAEVLPPTTKDRAKGPKGRRPPNRKPSMPISEDGEKSMSLSTTLIDEIESNLRQQSDESTSSKRVSQSMSNLCAMESSKLLEVLRTANGDSEPIKSADSEDRNSDSVTHRLSGLPDGHPGDESLVNGKGQRSSRSSVNRRSSTLSSKQLTNLTLELNQVIKMPNNQVSRLAHENRQNYKHVSHYEVADKENMSKASADSLNIGDLRANISHISAELTEVRRDISSLQDILSEHNCDHIQSQLQLNLVKVEECHKKFAEVIAEAEEARDQFQELALRCQLILHSLHEKGEKGEVNEREMNNEEEPSKREVETIELREENGIESTF
ncbi:hypothetical protein HDE_05197 [Halotydeus destructor]|nr:hypothetical protein HDE_05197 [Halotydeus destructor]